MRWLGRHLYSSKPTKSSKVILFCRQLCGAQKRGHVKQRLLAPRYTRSNVVEIEQKFSANELGLSIHLALLNVGCPAPTENQKSWWVVDPIGRSGRPLGKDKRFDGRQYAWACGTSVDISDVELMQPTWFSRWIPLLVAIFLYRDPWWAAIHRTQSAAKCEDCYPQQYHWQLKLAKAFLIWVFMFRGARKGAKFVQCYNGRGNASLDHAWQEWKARPPSNDNESTIEITGPVRNRRVYCITLRP